jgi:hypothetical protein
VKDLALGNELKIVKKSLRLEKTLQNVNIHFKISLVVMLVDEMPKMLKIQKLLEKIYR